MKRIGRKILALTLALLVVYLTAGAAYVQCHCTGKTLLVKPLDKKYYGDVEGSHCMKVSVEHLSDYSESHAVSYEFSIVQPLLCIVSQAFPYKEVVGRTLQPLFYYNKIPLPPKRNLYLQCSLLI